VVYAEGVEILRHNLPSGTLSASTKSLVPASSWKGAQYYRYSNLPYPAQFEGSSLVLAVAVFHASGETPANIVFDLELVETLASSIIFFFSTISLILLGLKFPRNIFMS